MTTAMEANQIMRPAYWLWLFLKVKSNGAITEAEAVDSGAAYLILNFNMGSSDTTRRYFQIAASSEGWLTEHRDEAGQRVWAFRAGLDLEAIQRKFERQAGVTEGTVPDPVPPTPSPRGIGILETPGG